MSKAHRGTGLRKTANHGRGECPICKTKGINPQEILKAEFMDVTMHKYGFHDWDSVLAAIGHGGLKEGQIVNRLLEELEKKHILTVIEQENGNLVNAAEHLGISRQTLYNKLKKFGTLV